MPQCSVFGCTSNSGDKGGVHHYSFPNRFKLPIIFNIWKDKCNRKNFEPSPAARICSLHFAPSDYNESDVLRLRLMPNSIKSGPKLKQNAVPSLHLKGDHDTPSGLPPCKKSRDERFKARHAKGLVTDLLGSSSKPSTSSQEVSAAIFVDDPENATSENSAIFPDDISEIDNYGDEEPSRDFGVQCEMGDEFYRKYDADDSGDVQSEYSVPELDQSFRADTDFGGSESESEDTDDADDAGVATDVDSESVESARYLLYFVFWTCLAELFKLCRECGAAVVSVHRWSKGAMLCVKTECEHGHELTWRSQVVARKQPVGNVILASAIMLSGMSFSSVRKFANVTNLLFFSKTAFHKAIKRYFNPVVKKMWKRERGATMDRLRREGNVRLSGDGQYDSPGYCAKFCIYSMMEINTGLIVDFQLVQKGMVKGDLEKAACGMLLESLVVNENLLIELFVTDRHRGIGLLMRTEYPNIIHEFDVWHLVKSIMKRLKAKEKKHPELSEWRRSINNHIWWSIESCGEDGDLLVEKYKSLLHHVINEHEWSPTTFSNQGHTYTKCSHPDLPKDRKTKWMHPNSDSYHALQKMVSDKTIVKDLKQARHYVHTGHLESYHNTRLVYTPKRIHYPFRGMWIRSVLTILDHNSNQNRIKKGEVRVWSKAQKTWLIRDTFATKSFQWMLNIMEKVHQKVENIDSDNDSDTEIEEEQFVIPRNIAPVPCPPRAEMPAKRRTRFAEKRSQ